jgi:DNA-binding NarL/FixJ family response regulator
MVLRLPDSGGIEAMIAVRAHFSEARVIPLSAFEAEREFSFILSRRTIIIVEPKP